MCKNRFVAIEHSRYSTNFIYTLKFDYKLYLFNRVHSIGTVGVDRGGRQREDGRGVCKKPPNRRRFVHLGRVLVVLVEEVAEEEVRRKKLFFHSRHH